MTMKTNETAKRTPGPWEIRERTDGLQNIYVEGTSFDIALCCKPKDAAFIVEACNNYERVLAERDELAAALRAVLPHAERGVKAVNAKMVGSLYPMLNESHLDSARVALAKLEAK